MMRNTCTILLLLLVYVELLVVCAAPDVAPVASYTDTGVSAGDMAVKWWQWIVNSATAPSSTDPTTAVPTAWTVDGKIDCTPYYQSGFDVPVIFFSGNLLPASGRPQRFCKDPIPVGTYVFFPILGADSDRPDPIPADNPLGSFACLRPYDSQLNPTGMKPEYLQVTVDGKSVPNLIDTFIVSQPQLFTVQPLPPPQVKVGSSFFSGPRWVQAWGYYLLLAPLPIGHHTIRIHVDASGVCGTPAGLLELDVTYKFDVGPRK